MVLIAGHRRPLILQGLIWRVCKRTLNGLPMEFVKLQTREIVNICRRCKLVVTHPRRWKFSPENDYLAS
jgi:hypothetical protein